MKALLLIALGVVATLAQESQVLKDFSVGYTQFTANVYKELLKSNSGNFLVCPLSVDIVLALIHDGARGNTARQLSAGLQLPEDKQKIQQIFKQVALRLKSNEDYSLRSANKVYIENGFAISEEFNNTAVKSFHAEIQNINFANNVQAAAEMNKWVAAKTNDLIKDLISEDDLDATTLAVLVNALYFHATWLTPFDDNETKKKPFYSSSTNKAEIDMMEITENFYYYESPEFDAKFLEMLYDGGEVSMTFILPNQVEGLPALEARIEDLLVTPQYAYDKVHVVIPKFKIETTIEFNPILKALGIVDAFEDIADFSGISAYQQALRISKVIQKAIIKVDEKGTTAAAASAVFGVERSGHFLPNPPKPFIADHPFIFCIKHSSLGVLFIGRYVQE